MHGLIAPNGNTFPEQILLGLLPALVTVLGGALAANLVVDLKQRRARRREVFESLSFEMWETAYSFYHRTQEQIWRQKYGQETNFTDLAQDYEAFRVAGRVLEAKLGATSEDQSAKWLWHGVMDMLGVRYYRLTQPEQRIIDFTDSHRAHPFKESKIPESVMKLFPDQKGLQDDRIVLAAFEKMLDASVKTVRATGGLRPFPH